MELSLRLLLLLPILLPVDLCDLRVLMGDRWTSTGAITVALSEDRGEWRGGGGGGGRESMGVAGGEPGGRGGGEAVGVAGGESARSSSGIGDSG